MITVRSPSQDLFSLMMRACAVTSVGESCGNSLGCVCIHPSGSIPFKYSCSGSALGKLTAWCVPHWGTSTAPRISFTCGRAHAAESPTRRGVEKAAAGGGGRRRAATGG